jgi:hypothetical protein
MIFSFSPSLALLKVKQIGGIACHTGRKSCFFQKLDKDNWVNISKVLKDPKAIYVLAISMSLWRNNTKV